MKITTKFKIAELEDIFYGDIRKGTTPHWLKPHIPHCILEKDELKGIYFTPDAFGDLDLFTYYLQLVFDKQLLIVNNMYSASPFTKEISLAQGTLDNFHAYSPYYYKNGNEVSGPFILGEEFIGLNPNYYKNRPIIQAFNAGNIYIITG